ncbi:hypothetical protein SODALDRAFT_194805 [Sodiomyces alkalinus F11]|uniref:Uncharacterized protein n=1 Tax=Sodiomyces alkalinus (strain CBS 110278 / VKM F-3762 / F11) TaxID=1314773 RepID=A0A3N2PS89_SODAK|nr:hypothetical protein SODALDRAFT_194805 [Sodiomyces alkalinus F11]ROT37348.1 hypothetical protein SODALDRAFT_194805 [Sodiomyces alkalinus F11]
MPADPSPQVGANRGAVNIERWLRISPSIVHQSINPSPLIPLLITLPTVLFLAIPLRECGRRLNGTFLPSCFSR